MASSRYRLTEADRQDIALKVAKELQKTDYLTARQVSKILGISISRVYQIKEKLGYIKIGEHQQSPIRFQKLQVLKFFHVNNV